MHETDTATLLELNEGYMRSVRESDTRWFEQHLAPDFVNGNPDCTLADRRAFMAAMARPCAVSNLRAEDVRIQDLGDIAVIRARTAYTKADGSAGAGRYTDVWARKDDGWQCVCADVTRK
jgi:ketosteroid isomerase-like protein